MATSSPSTFSTTLTDATFLHPSAQAEFGRALRELSAEMGIQIIVTTHSPYMLNQEDPTANVLLSRKIVRGKYMQTCIVKTSENGWMEPLAENLGISASEFTSLKPPFSTENSKVLLVEGDYDVEYFQLMKSDSYVGEKLDNRIDVVPYGGKSTLKNTTLLQFVLRRFDMVFCTFDLDADAEARPALSRAGLAVDTQSIALGLPLAGRDCIEGLVPESVLARVNSRETDLVMALGSSDSSERKKAKNDLKKRYIAEMKSATDLKYEDLKEFNKRVKKINSFFGRQKS